MLYLHHNTSPINYTTLLDRLTYKGEGISPDYVLSLPDSVINDDDSYVDKNVTLLKDLSFKRELYLMGKYLTDEEIKGISSENLVKKVSSVLDNVKVTSNLEVNQIGSTIDNFIDNYDKQDDPNDLYTFGYKLLDGMVQLNRTNLMLVSARPSLGKSALALEMSLKFAKQGKKVLFITLEMSDKEVMKRALANVSGVEAKKIKRKLPLTYDEKKRLEEASKEIKSLPLYVYYGGSMHITHLQNLSKKLRKENKCDIVIVDYLQLLSSSNNQSRNNEVSEISRGLKVLAQDLNIPVIALSQLSRAVVDKGGKVREPQLSDLRDSGSLEQDKGSGLICLNHMNKNKYLLELY